MTAPEQPPLSYAQLDRGLTAWGVAIPYDDGIFAVVAHKSRQAAEEAATGADELDDEPWDDAPLVYYNPDRGWVFAATGHSCRTL